MLDMEYNRTSPFISNCLHYSSKFHPYVGEFPYLCRNIRAGGKPHRLSDFIKEIDKEHIGDIRKYQLFVVDLLHISRPLSIFFTLSRAALSCFALSFAAARALRIEGFFSRFSFFAENS